MAESAAQGLAGATIQCAQARWLVSDRLLGQGGFAKVYEATAITASPHADVQRSAVKVVDLRLQSLWAQGKLRSEADTLRCAQGSDYIVRFFGEVRQGPFQVFILEAWGESDLLEEVLKHRGLGEARSRGVLVQLLEALAWLHSKRICHGDVKPENLLCSRRGGIDRVKLADFGSAMLLPPEGSAAVDPVAQGTTLYSPPEVLLGKTYSYAADMWATGITSYVLISGNFPFGSTADALSSSASFDGPAWSSTPRPRDFISALLLHDPWRRPTATQARRHAWMLTRPRHADHDRGTPPPVAPLLRFAPLMPPPMPLATCGGRSGSESSYTTSAPSKSQSPDPLACCVGQPQTPPARPLPETVETPGSKRAHAACASCSTVAASSCSSASSDVDKPRPQPAKKRRGVRGAVTPPQPGLAIGHKEAALPPPHATPNSAWDPKHQFRPLNALEPQQPAAPLPDGAAKVVPVPLVPAPLHQLNARNLT